MRGVDGPKPGRGDEARLSEARVVLALAARVRGIPAYIVMPRTAPAVKKAAVEGYGGIVTECEPTHADRERTAAGIVARNGGTLIPPFDHPDVIAGQGTAALELMSNVKPRNEFRMVLKRVADDSSSLAGWVLAWHVVLGLWHRRTSFDQ